jgi:hypothetical protein
MQPYQTRERKEGRKETKLLAGTRKDDKDEERKKFKE